MIWVILTALAAVCGAAKLDTSYLPPISAKTAGGSPGALLAPLVDPSQGPTGSYANDVQGVVVDAVNPGTRTSGLEPTGLGGPRASYGSTNSKVGNDAFRGPVAGLANPGPLTRIAPGFGSFVESDDAQAESNGNKLKFTSDVGLENYSYKFETDNGISVAENGEAADGVKAQGGYSYKGDDGKTYSVSYTADKGGYKPEGQHLPTSPPIPNEILISLEKNAKEEAAGHVDDGSYDAQKYNDEGDYTSNGAGSNNGGSIIGGGVATTGGSYVIQSVQAQRPTSGVLVGTYKPGSVASHSSQGHSAQGSAHVSRNKQTVLGLSKEQNGSPNLGISGGSSSIGGQFGQAGSKGGNTLSYSSSSQDSQSGVSTQSTENRFGIQSTKSEGAHAHAHASVGGSPVRSSNFQNGASAYSSAISSGSGSASAFASTGPLSSELKNEYVSGLHSFGSAGHRAHVSDSSSSALFPAPATATASASTLGSQTQLPGVHTQGQSPSSASASATISGNQKSHGHLTEQIPSRFGESQKTGNFNTQLSGAKPAQATFGLESNQASNSVGSVSTTQVGSIDATYASSTQKPFISQQQGSDDSYYYKQPSKPFVIPTAVPTSQFSNNRQPNIPISSVSQQGTKYPNSPVSSATGQYQGTSFSSTNGITQAAVSSFPSDSSSSSTQFASQSSQFGSQPSTQLGQSSQHTTTQFGSTETHSGQKPIVQSQTQFGQSPSSQISGGSQTSTQQYQGTIYQYNKPATTLPADNSQAKPGQIATDSRFGTQQKFSQFGSQSTFQQTQTGSKVQPTKFGQKPIVSSQVTGSNYQFGSSGSQFGQNTQSQISFGQKPVGSSQTTTQFGPTGLEFGSKPQKTQGSSFTYSQSQTSQFGKKPVSTVQSGVTSQQTQFGSSGSQFGQNSQSTFGSGLVSTTNKPSYGQKPFGQQTHFGSSGSQFGQNVQSSVGSISATNKPSFSSYQQSQFSSKPQTTQGSSFSYTQSQTSQFEKKPVISATQTGTQQSQFGSSGFQFGQNSQSTQDSGLVSTTVKPSYSQKPFGSANQQTQFGSAGLQFGSKPQTTQGSSFTYSQATSQTSQFGKKPVTTNTGVTSQQTQFGSSGSQFGQSSQSVQGSGAVSTTTAKPSGSSYQLTQFGSAESQLGSKPQPTQGSSLTYFQATSQTSKFGKIPVTPNTGVTSQQTQFGSSGSQFGQNSQSSFDSSSVSTTAKPSFSQKPFGSSYQQTQFGSQFGQNSQSVQSSGTVSSTTAKPFGSSYQQTQVGSTGSQFDSKPQTTQGSSFTYSQSQTSQFGKKPVSTVQSGVITQQTQLVSSGSKFGQNSQSTFGSGLVSTTVKPTFSQKPFGSNYQQTQFGSTGSKFTQNSQSSSGTGVVSTTAKPSFSSSYQQTQFGLKPQTIQGSSFTNSQSQTSLYGKKPVSSTQTGVSSQTTQSGSSGSQFSQNSQFGSSGSQFGQNSQSTGGTVSVSTTAKPSFGSYQQTQFGLKPQTTQGSSFTYSQASSQTSQFGKKPTTPTTQTGTQQSQFGSTGFQFGQSSQSTQGSGLVSTNAKPSYGQKPILSSYQQAQFGSTGIGSQFGQNTLSNQGSGFTSTVSQTSTGIKPVYQQAQFGSSGSQFSQGQTSQFGKKPVSSTQFGVISQQTQFGSSGSQFGLNSQLGSSGGAVSTTAKPFGSSYEQTQFGSKPQSTQGSSFTYGQTQTSQYGKKPVSTTQTGVSSQTTQFGSSGSQFGQSSQSSVGSETVSTTPKPFGSSYQQTQFGSKPQTTQVSSFTYGQSQTTQYGKKPVSTTQTGVSSQFGSFGSQFGQNSQSSVGSGTVSTTPKPFGSSYQQTQFGSKPQTTQVSSFTYGQSQTTQYGKKPVSTTQTGVSSQFGSSGSQFGQNSQSSVGSGTVSTTVKPFGSSYQQTQFGSKPQTTQGSKFTYSQGSSQTSQFGKQPSVGTTQTGLTSQQTQFGLSNSQFGQNYQSTQGSAVPSSTPKPVSVIKPVYQQAQFGSGSSQLSQNSQSTQGSGFVSTIAKPSFGQTSFGSSSQFGSSGSQYGQKPQTTQSSSFTSNIYSQSQTSQFGKQPETSQTGSTFQQTQFGSTGQKPITTGVTSSIAQASFGQKPSTAAGSFYQQSQFGSTGSQFVQKPQSATQAFTSSTASKGEAVQTSQFGVVGSSQTTGSSSQSSQFGSSTGSQYGLKPQLSQGIVGVSGVQAGNKISGSSSASGSSFQQTQVVGSSGSQFGQVNQGTISQAKPVQTIQYGIKPFGSSQNTQGSTQFGSLTPSRFGEPSQTVVPTITTISQTVQPTPFAQKPIQTQFGSNAAHFGQNPQALASAFASSSGSNVVPFGSTQTVSKYQNSQLGAQDQSVVSTTQKPIVSSFSQTNKQQYQYTQTTNKFGSQSQFGQGVLSNVDSGQIGQTTFGAQSQKPFGSQSTQTTYQQTQFTQGQKPFGSSQGSAFQIGESVVDQPSQGTIQTSSVAGYEYQKPQSVFTTQFGSIGNGAQDQKLQKTQSNYNSAVSTSQTPISGEPIKPFGFSSTQSTLQQTQSNVGTNQFGAQPAKPTDFSGPVIQTSYNQFSGKPFQPASTVSTQVSNVQSQSSAVSTSQFGLQQPTKPTEIVHFSGQPFQSSSTHGSGFGSHSVVGSTPEYSIHPSQGIVLSTQEGVHSSTSAPSVPSRIGSNEALAVSTVQTPIVPVPGYEIVTSNHGASHGFVGLGEQFGGPRDPPRYDDKTGYHY